MSISAQGTEQIPESLLDRSYIRGLIRYATMRTGFPVFDEDLEQEASLHVLQAVHRVRHIEYPKAFVAKIVRDVVQDFWRKSRKIHSQQLKSERTLSYRPTLEAGIDDGRMREQLYECLNRLPCKTRSAVEMFYLQECSVRDVAELLQFSYSATKMTLLRGRRELRRMMEEICP